LLLPRPFRLFGLTITKQCTRTFVIVKTLVFLASTYCISIAPLGSWEKAPSRDQLRKDMSSPAGNSQRSGTWSCPIKTIFGQPFGVRLPR